MEQTKNGAVSEAGLAVVDGYVITSHLQRRWEEELRPMLYSVLAGDSNLSVDMLINHNAVNQQLARLVATYVLGFVDPSQPYGTPFFDATNLLSPHFAFEGVYFRENPDTRKPEVYLMKRRDDDTAYPGEYHCPGSAVRNREDWQAVAVRLARGEFKTPIKSITPLYEAGFWYQESRGWYYSLPIMVELDGEPAEGKWYPADSLPEKTVHHHRDSVIPAAVAYWKNKKLYEAGRFLCRLALGLEKYDADHIHLAISACNKLMEDNR